MSNAAVKALVVEINQDLDNAKSSNDIAASIKKAVDYGKPLVYNHVFHYLIGVSLIVAGCVGCYIFLFAYVEYPYAWMYLEDDSLGVFCGLIAIGGIAPIVVAYRNSSKLEDLSKRAFSMDARLDHGLAGKPFPDEETIKAEFSEFIRGNHSREFKDYLEASWEGKEQSIKYDYFQYHYVTKTQSTYTVRDSKGNMSTRTKTVYRDYDRYGLIIDFPYAREIQICTGMLARAYEKSYQPASVNFNKHFVVKASSEHAAAKFLKPSVVVAIEDIRKTFSNLNIEISGEGRLCMAFLNSDLLRGEQQYDLSEPKKYYQDLVEKTDLDKLEQALKFLHQIIKHSDSNF